MPMTSPPSSNSWHPSHRSAEARHRGSCRTRKRFSTRVSPIRWAGPWMRSSTWCERSGTRVRRRRIGSQGRPDHLRADAGRLSVSRPVTRTDRFTSTCASGRLRAAGCLFVLSLDLNWNATAGGYGDSVLRGPCPDQLWIPLGLRRTRRRRLVRPGATPRRLSIAGDWAPNVPIPIQRPRQRCQVPF
jgi:hypothetical protein